MSGKDALPERLRALRSGWGTEALDIVVDAREPACHFAIAPLFLSVRPGGTLFQSACYVGIFLFCVIILGKVRAHRLRQVVLLAASFALYLTWVPWFSAVLVASVVANFLLGKWLRRKPTALPLWTGIVFNLALLSVFKYVPAVSTRIPLSSL